MRRRKTSESTTMAGPLTPFGHEPKLLDRSWPADPSAESFTQHGQVQKSSIDLSSVLALVAIVLSLYSLTATRSKPAEARPIDVSGAPQSTEPVEPRVIGHLCDDGQALRGVTAAGTAICTDLSPGPTGHPTSMLPTASHCLYSPQLLAPAFNATKRATCETGTTLTSGRGSTGLDSADVGAASEDSAGE